MNKAMIIGNLGKDPELSYTQSGQPVCKFPVATRDKWKDKSGEWKEITDWHNVVIWGKLGETVAKYIQKGSQVYVEGKNKTRKYADKSGGPDRYITEISVNSMDGGKVEFLDSKRDRQDSGSQHGQYNQPENTPF